MLTKKKTIATVKRLLDHKNHGNEQVRVATLVGKIPLTKTCSNTSKNYKIKDNLELLLMKLKKQGKLKQKKEKLGCTKLIAYSKPRQGTKLINLRKVEKKEK